MDNKKNCILLLTQKILQHLQQKPPPRHNADSAALLPDKPLELHPTKCASINTECASKVTLKTRGATEPSRLDFEDLTSCLNQLNFE